MRPEASSFLQKKKTLFHHVSLAFQSLYAHTCAHTHTHTGMRVMSLSNPRTIISKRIRKDVFSQFSNPERYFFAIRSRSFDHVPYLPIPTAKWKVKIVVYKVTSRAKIKGVGRIKELGLIQQKKKSEQTFHQPDFTRSRYRDNWILRRSHNSVN
jgi:hypothetical protein